MNKSKKLVFGVGTNDVKGACKTKAFQTWQNMLKRCYYTKFHVTQPTYIGTHVCTEWLTFSVFKEWFDDHYVEGFDLDKDLRFIDSKMYSPVTCTFVPQSLNKLFTNRARNRGDYPCGVCFNKQRQKFESQISILGKRKHLGLFNTVEEAQSAYQSAKREHALTVLDVLTNEYPTNITLIKLIGVIEYNIDQYIS